MPVLEIDGAVLTESLVTVEYLAERDGGAFYLADAQRRASARLLQEVHPFGGMFDYIKAKDDAELLAEAVAKFEKGVADFEACLALHAPEGPFLGGADLCFADAAVAPFVQRLVPALAHYASVDVRAICARHPRVDRFVAAILERPSVVASGVPAAKFIENTDRMLERFASMKK